MVSFIRTQFKFWSEWPRRSKRSPRQKTQRSGFTLIELIVASALVSVIILVSWSGLISLMNMSSVAEAKSARQLEVNQAIDFVTEEIRKAQSINTDGNSIVDGSTTDIADLLTNQGFDLTNLGNYGDLALYLEIPAVNPRPAICPAGGPNAGSPPPSPSDYDQVIYDIRASSSEWLAPRTLMRYGRIHDFNSSFNPCDSPVASDPIADALSDDDTNTASCSGVLTGGPGFYACSEENQTRLIVQSTLADSIVEEVSGNVTSRLQPIGGGATIAGTDCANESDLRSLNRDNPVSIKFHNQSPDTVKLFWLDEAGTRQQYAVMNSGTKVEIDTYKTHPWVVSDTGGNCLNIYVPEEKKGKVVIEGSANTGGGTDSTHDVPGDYYDYDD